MGVSKEKKRKDETRRRNAKYRLEHPDVVRAAKKAWAEKHPEKTKEHSSNFRLRNATQVKDANRKFRENNPEYRESYYRKNEEKFWARAIEKRYGIKPEQYMEMLVRQNGVCAICRKKGPRRLSVDHDHVTNQVRGLLCDECNTALGKFKDDPLLLRSAADYLERFHGQQEGK